MKKLFSFLSYFAVILTLPLIPFGALVRLKGAGLACPDWPLCYGDLMPADPTLEIFLEVFHRYVATLLGFVIMIMFFMVLFSRALQSAKKRVIFAFIVVVLQGILGAYTVTLSLNPYIVALHLIGGNFLLWILMYNIYGLYSDHNALKLDQKDRDKLRFRPVLFVNCFFFLMLFSGGLNSGYSAGYFCDAFVLCHANDPLTFSWNSEIGLTDQIHDENIIVDETIVPKNILEWIHMTHRFTVILGSFLIIYYALRFWRNVKKPMFSFFSYLLIGFIILEVIVGITNALLRIPVPVSSLHNFIAALINILLCFFYFTAYQNKKQKRIDSDTI